MVCFAVWLAAPEPWAALVGAGIPPDFASGFIFLRLLTYFYSSMSVPVDISSLVKGFQIWYCKYPVLRVWNSYNQYAVIHSQYHVVHNQYLLVHSQYLVVITRSVPGSTQSVPGTTQSAPGSTQSVPRSTQSIPGSTQNN